MVKLSDATIRLLNVIEDLIDPEVEDDYHRQWIDFLNGRNQDPIFRARRKKTFHTDYVFQNVNINDAIADYELMLVSQMEGVLNNLTKTDRFLSVRSNYGVGILPSLFGTELFIMPREMNTLPNVRALSDEQISNALGAGVPSTENGLGRQVLQMGEIYKEVFSHYPKINKYVNVYHPNAQGPLDSLELVWGSDMFYAMYDEPEQIHAMLELITKTYIVLLEKWYELYPQTEYSIHWDSVMHKGSILLPQDSAMNISDEMYREFARPYDAKLLDHFNGGVIHFCGRGDHFIESMSQIPKLYGINLSQPHLNDREKIYRNTVDKGIPILAYERKWAETDKDRPGGFGHLLSE